MGSDIVTLHSWLLLKRVLQVFKVEKERDSEREISQKINPSNKLSQAESHLWLSSDLIRHLPVEK